MGRRGGDRLARGRAVSDQPSPLGRYDDIGAAGEQLHEVRLIGVPVRILAAGRQQHDDLMREFGMLAVAHADGQRKLPQRLLELIEVLGSRFGGAANRPDAAVDDALRAGRTTVDLTYQVPDHIVASADRLEALMAEADEFCRTEHMLTLPRSDLVKEFSRWYLDEFRRQVHGQPPQPWPGPVTS